MELMREDVELLIQELVLHGFAPGDRHRIAKAIERELTRLLSYNAIPPSLRQVASVDEIDVVEFAVPFGSDADAIGIKVAQAVYGGLGRGAVSGERSRPSPNIAEMRTWPPI